MSAVLEPPMGAIDVETFVVFALCVLFAGVWLRDREPGMGCIALALLLMGSWYFVADRQLRFSGPNMDAPAVRYWGVELGVSILLINVGVVRYLGMPEGWWRSVLVVFGVPAIIIVAALAIGWTVPRRVYHFGLLWPYVGSAILAFRRQRDEPGAGHVILGLVLLSLPLTPVVMLVAGVDPQLMRYVAALPVIVFAAILLTVGLLRRRRQLELEVQRRIEAEHAVRDVNQQLEQRVAERTAHLHEVVAALEGFNRSVSHDLRGPLGGMAQLARMASARLQTGDPTLALSALPAIATQADASTRLVTTLLELAKLGETRARRQRVSLERLVRAAYDEVVLGLRGAAAPPLRCGALPDVLADPDLLRPALVNLIANAVKFSRDAEQPLIEIAAHFEGDTLVLSVADNGVGFDPAVAGELFTPFRRFHSSRFEGYGLGLSLVRRAVEIHGGRVWANSRGSAGAEFGFSIPEAMPPPAQRAGHVDRGLELHAAA